MSETLTLEPRRRLGRGLSALLGGGTPSPTMIEGKDKAELRNIPVETLSRNPFQPRKEFDPEGLKELSDSIKEHGILQPLLAADANASPSVLHFVIIGVVIWGGLFLRDPRLRMLIPLRSQLKPNQPKP